MEYNVSIIFSQEDMIDEETQKQNELCGVEVLKML